VSDLPLTYDVLVRAAKTAAAFRCRRKLQPAGGEGDKVFPPTYEGGVYAVETRRVRRPDGKWDEAVCVLVDSVQSQANRMEEAIQDAIDDGLIAVPYVTVDFSRTELLDPVRRVTSLQAPHRLADAILRDSEWDGKPFRESSKGIAIDAAGADFATPLFGLSPNTLVYGMWDSTGKKGGLGTKFERAVVSEMFGVGAEVGIRSSSRIDPIITKTSAIALYRKGDDGYTLEAAEADKDKGGKPILYGKKGKASEANLGNVTPSVTDDKTKKPLLGGITVEHVEQSTVLSLIQLRRLRFPAQAGEASTPDRDVAARAMLAAIGLCGAVLAFENGVDLRSRAVLFPLEPMTFDLLDRPGQTPEQFALDRHGAAELVKQAAAAVVAAGLPWETDPLVLTPSKQLVQLVRKSQELAVASGVEGED
jgi:CRISPR-associated protein Csb1